MYKLIRTWNDWEDKFNKNEPIFCDTETYTEVGKTSGGLYGAVRLIQCFQQSWEYEAQLFDCMFLELNDVLDILKKYHLVFHNASYDLHTINCHTKKLWLPEEVDDTVYMSRLALYDKGTKFGFYDCLKYCKEFSEDLEDINKAENQKADWGGVLSQEMLKYAAFDVLKLADLCARVSHVTNTETYKLDIANLKYAIEYSRRGIPIGEKTRKDELLKNTIKYERLLEKLPINPNSAKQCCELLGSASSNIETLVELSMEGNEYAADILEARKASKTINFLHRYSNGIVKGFYNPSSAVGGRFSCTGGHRYYYDNLQQIPRRLLHVMEAPDGQIFIYKDYSGLELRMVVSWTGEPVMAQLMFDGVDVHTFTGCALFNRTSKTLTKHERNVGKTFTFASLYGAKEAMIQRILKTKSQITMSISEIRKLMKKYFSTYEYFDAWHKMHTKQMNVYGYMDIITALGRKVRTYGLTDSLALPIQGSASEVTKVSLMMLKTKYPDENLISTIHDSNTLLVNEDVAELWKDRLNECMIDAWYYVIKNLAIPDLPMPAEAEIGKAWRF